VPKKIPIPEAPVASPRWARNAVVARYLGISTMCLWRWSRDPKLGFPPPSNINGIDYTDLNLIDAWMKRRVIDRTKKLEIA
jgi:hypothetical protein